MNTCSNCEEEFLACTCYPEWGNLVMSFLDERTAPHDPIFGRRSSVTPVTQYAIYRIDATLNTVFKVAVATTEDVRQYIVDHCLLDASHFDKFLAVRLSDGADFIYIVEEPPAVKSLVDGVIPHD